MKYALLYVNSSIAYFIQTVNKLIILLRKIHLLVVFKSYKFLISCDQK